MITVFRILFGIATFFIVSFGTVFIAKGICRYDQKASDGRFRSVAWFLSTVVAAVFVTLWCVSRGIV